MATPWWQLLAQCLPLWVVVDLCLHNHVRKDLHIQQLRLLTFVAFLVQLVTFHEVLLCHILVLLESGLYDNCVFRN